jgi:hypothetical protein
MSACCRSAHIGETTIQRRSFSTGSLRHNADVLRWIPLSFFFCHSARLCEPVYKRVALVLRRPALLSEK